MLGVCTPQELVQFGQIEVVEALKGGKGLRKMDGKF